MKMKEAPYEMPLETEESYNKKIESGEIILEKEPEFDDNWIPDYLLEV